MFEKVNPGHPDKVADRIAGAIVDYAYSQDENPRIAVEVLIGHGKCCVLTESSFGISEDEIIKIIDRVSKHNAYHYLVKTVPQDKHLAENQDHGLRCGDNGIFKGMPVTDEQRNLCMIADALWKRYVSDGKYVLTSDKLIICQSRAECEDVSATIPIQLPGIKSMQINPLGFWTGGVDVDSGATNRKLGSDMGDSVTGGGLHGKDLSKADVSVNVYAWLVAQETQEPVELYCAIGDEMVTGTVGGLPFEVPFEDTVKAAREYIRKIGGFEKFAEWGLIRP